MTWVAVKAQSQKAEKAFLKSKSFLTSQGGLIIGLLICLKYNWIYQTKLWWDHKEVIMGSPICVYTNIEHQHGQWIGFYISFWHVWWYLNRLGIHWEVSCAEPELYVKRNCNIAQNPVSTHDTLTQCGRLVIAGHRNAKPRRKNKMNRALGPFCVHTG